MFSAEQAWQYHLIDEVVKEAELNDLVSKLKTTIQSNAPKALREVAIAR